MNAPDSPPPAARPVGLFCGLAVVDVIQLVEAPPAPDDKIVALDQIIAAGFDGAFLDVMDAWQYFK